VQQAFPGILRTLALLALLAGLALALVVALVYWQGERSEVRRVDALVLLPTTAQLQSAAFNYAQTLYRQGQAPVLILAAAEDSDIDTLARQANIPEEDVLLAEADTTASRAAHLRAVAELARREGIQTVLLLSHPDQLLLDLKIAGDAGLEAYGAPPPGSERAFPAMVQASLDYWNYVLLGG
jgi:non-ribosomal peptide synthetase component E (peptide arylation enzyme)